jgi:hypothetical protein
MVKRENPEVNTADLGPIPQSSTSYIAYDLPTPPEIDDKQAKSLVESLNRAADRRAQSSRDRAVAVEEAIARRSDSLKENLGDREYQSLVDYSRKRRRPAIRPGDYQPGELQISDRYLSRSDSLRESKKFLKDTRIDLAEIETANAAFHDEIESIFKPRIDPDVAKIDFHKDSLITAMGGTMDGASRVAPPFHGWWSEASVYRRAGSLSHHNNLLIEENPFTIVHGHVGHNSHYVKYGAGGYDGLYPKGGAGNLYLLLTYNTEVGFWFTPSEAGTKTVQLKIRCKKARFDIWLDDEFGWSDSASYIWSRLHANIIPVHGLEFQTEFWHHKRLGNPDNSWLHIDWIPPESTFFLVFEANFPAEPVYVAVGCFDEHRVFLNDVSTDQTMNSRFILEEVLIID